MTPIPGWLLEHYDDPYHRGACDRPTHAAECRCEATGCQLRVELRFQDEEVLSEAWFEGAGCVHCEALTSALLERVEGESAVQLRQLSQEALLDGLKIEAGGQPPCGALPLLTLHQALENPVEALDGDLADGGSFGGPSLREEC